MTNNNQLNLNSLLNEILPLPSEKIVTDRFATTDQSEASSCNGKCRMGTCEGFV